MSSKRKDTIITGAALFAMFFGAGNLIFPPSIGIMAGGKWLLSLIGFILTGIGLPVMGVIAVAKTGGTINHLSGRVGPTFAKIFGSIAVLAVGPLLAIPRTGATVYEIGIRPLIGPVNPWFVAIIYFSLTLFFVIKPSTIVDTIGKFLTPILLFVISVIILKGIFIPIGHPTVGTVELPFAKGFTDGYQTMDAFVAISMAGILLLSLKNKGYTDEKDQISMTIRAGLIAGGGLLVIYGGLLYLGATSGSVFPQSVTKSELIVGITNQILGQLGQMSLCVVVSAACLTTAIGITAIVGNFFSELTGGRLSYTKIVIGTSIFSAVMSVTGIEYIIKLAEPLLALVYPVAIVLILMGLFDQSIKNKNMYKGAVTGALLVSTFDALAKVGLQVEIVNNTISKLPLASSGFAWLLPAIILTTLFGLIPEKAPQQQAVLAVENA